MRNACEKSHFLRNANVITGIVVFLFVAGAVLALLVIQHPARMAAAPRPNVILITVDTLRADHVGCYGNSQVETPAMDALAEDGVLFRRAVAQVPLTAPSHAAILTGTYPFWNGVRDWSDTGLRPDTPTLGEVFQRHGYETAAFVSAFVLDSMWGLNRGFQHYDDWFKAEDYKSMRRFGLERRSEETIDRCMAWLETSGSNPFFLWVHLYDPHAPYRPPEPFKSKYQGRPYDGEVASADHQLARFLAFLKSQGLYSSSLIVLTSDHGEALGDHQEQEHGFFIYNASVHVPLIVKFPAGYGAVQRSVTQVVNTVDIAPTLIRFCGFPSDDSKSFQGQSLLPLVAGGAASSPRYGYSESLYPRNFMDSSALFGIQTERYHYVRAPSEELYDLEQDPEEEHNLVGEKPAIAQSLQQALQEIISRYHRPRAEPGQNANLDAETVEKLRSLGYVSLSAPKPPPEDDPHAPDPKDRIGAYNQIMQAMKMAEDGHARQANTLLAALESKSPKAFLLPFLRGENSRGLGDSRKAVTAYRRALELNPVFDQAAVGLGQAAYTAEQNEEAAKAYKLALQLNPHNFLARLALAKVYWRLSRLPEAAEEQLEVLRDHPRFAQAHGEYGITLVRMMRFSEAVPALLKSVELGYQDAAVFNFLANAYMAEGREEDAVRAYEQALDRDPNYPTPYINLAMFYRQKGDATKSRQYFRKACRLNPEVCRQLDTRIP